MAAGVTEHLWEMSGIVALWEAVEPKAAPERDVDMSRAQHDALDLRSHEIAVTKFPQRRGLTWDNLPIDVLNLMPKRGDYQFLDVRSRDASFFCRRIYGFT